MLRLSNLILVLAFVLQAISQTPGSKTTVSKARRTVPSSRASENPWDVVPQNTPCAGQAKSFADLAAAFRRGRFPLTSQIGGTWVEIGSIYAHPEFKRRNLNCSGEEFRNGKLVSVLITKGDRVEMNFGGDIQNDELKPDHKGSVTFSRDLEADGAEDTYLCRLTTRGTLVCLLDPKAGVEFKKMKVDKSQLVEENQEP